MLAAPNPARPPSPLADRAKREAFRQRCRPPEHDAEKWKRLSVSIMPNSLNSITLKRFDWFNQNAS
jgi:hypothetical protein